MLKTKRMTTISFCIVFALALLNLYGSDELVNQIIPDDQMYPPIGIDSSGNFIVAWDGYGYYSVGSGDSQGIHARIFPNDGTEMYQFLVNDTGTNNNQEYPSISVDSYGNFIIAWESKISSGNYDIKAQRYYSDGTKNGSEINVNPYSSGNQNRPCVAISDSGCFVITWDGKG